MQKFCLAALLMLGSVAGAMAVEVSQADWENMKAQISDLQSRNAHESVVSSVDSAMDGKYGPCANVTTKNGKLTISGLVQVWYTQTQNDNRGLFDSAVTGISDTNETRDNDGFRIRRTELKFTMDLCENITAVVMIDPAREAGGFSHYSDSKKLNSLSPEFNAANVDTGNAGVDARLNAAVNLTRNGGFGGSAPRLLQDAYINYHGVIPHHCIQVGQFKPWVGEEGIRSSGELDFVERSMVGVQSDSRDLGASIHGSWWGCDKDGRVQYWAGVFNGAGSYYEPGNQQNRQNDNDNLDYNARLLVRPLWDDCWGRLELGASFMGGRKGESGSRTPFQTPINGLNSEEHWATRYNAWASYKFGNVLSGLWLKSEATLMYDREAGDSVIDILGNGTGAFANTQEAGATFNRRGIYGAVGYNLGQSKICGLPCWAKSLELVGRYDQFQNVATADLVNPRHTDVFYTKTYTAGLNYHFVGHNAKIQANYNWVDDPDGNNDPNRSFRNVRNNSFAVNFQVMF